MPLGQQPSEQVKEEIRSRLDIVEVVGRYVALKSAGQNMKGLCPFHKEKTPSFTVHPVRSMYHCFGCGKGGDVFSFLMEIEGLSFPEVLRMTAEEVGVRLPDTRTATISEAKPGGPSKTELMRIHEIATLFFYQQMKATPKAIEYYKSRGLTGRTVKEFRLGYAPAGWNAFIDFAGKQGIAPDALVSCGLAIRKEETGSVYDRFRDRTIFPIFDISGRPIAFGARAMEADASPKYLNSPETLLYRKNRTLYGLHAARAAVKERNFAIFVEGYMDWLSLHQAGIRNCVATSGTALTPEHGQLIRRFSPRVVLLFDGDSAGVEAAQRAVFILAPLGLEVKVLILPETEDPDSFVRARGPEALLELIGGATEGVQFLLTQMAGRHDESTPQGKAAIVQQLTPLLQGIGDEVVVGEYVKRIAERLGTREDAIMAKLGRGQSRQAPPSRLTNTAKEYLQTEEGSLLHILARNPDLVEFVTERVPPETLSDPFSKDLYSIIVQSSVDGTQGVQMLDRASSPNMREVLSLMLIAEPWSEGQEQDLHHKVRRVMLRSLKDRHRALKSKLRTEASQEVRTSLLVKQREVIRKLKELADAW